MLAESALIVFSVLLALAVDQWRDARSHRQLADTAHQEILEELRANRASVAEALQYHSALMDSLAAYRDQNGVPSARLFSRGFISPAQVSGTAWESASETGALTHMDYAVVLRLSRVYAQQDRYAEQNRSFGEVLYSEIYRGGLTSVVENHRNLASIIGTFRYREGELLDLYDQTLSALPAPQRAR
ncbi:MAG TPA: hypothetical protein VHG35_02585 [Gemmatimonadales bacterium]|nr:hypothetical protein [Gemmatimonadales bacterium]